MTRLALMWHMHQPYYEDLATGEHILPWVRLHAIKDYWGMVALLEEFPGVRVTFNLVPSLVVQLDAFSEGRARDRHLELGLAPVEELSRHDREFLVANGFHAPVARMIAPYPRYAELHARRLDPATFDHQDLRDLQVWHKLAWMDPDWTADDERLQALVARGRGFTEHDKAVLREVELELLNAVVPAYRAAAARGQVELSVSPFYHPILPLLCDTDIHLRAHPESARPAVPFRRPEDARAQIERAVAFHTERFGSPPQGMWPSEGSVSDAMVPLVAEAGLAWIATDEDILARSLARPLQPGELYRPYEVVPSTGRAAVRILFRDHAMSDLIGFTYQSWRAEDAAADFVARVREAGRRHSDATGGEVATVSVILDGENAWEHYEGGGRPFLRALYSALASAADIQTVTMADASAGAARQLGSVFPGSWINGDFYIWAGHRDDQRAWTQVATARAAYEAAPPEASASDRARAYDELLIAEGSDWFWWYGDDHSSDHDREFDDLFRRHVRNVYRCLRLAVPQDLFHTNITTAVGADHRIRLTRFLAPARERGLGYGAWLGAEAVPAGGPAGAMHQVAGHFADVRMGATPTDLWVLAAGHALAGELAAGRITLVLEAHVAGGVRCLKLAAHAVPGSFVASAPLIEIAPSGSPELTLSLGLADASGAILERRPADRPVTVSLPGPSALEPPAWRV